MKPRALYSKLLLLFWLVGIARGGDIFVRDVEVPTATSSDPAVFAAEEEPDCDSSCLPQLEAADDDGDGRVVRDEYLVFAQSLGYQRDSLSLALSNQFGWMACQCGTLGFGDGGSGVCCEGESAHIDVATAKADKVYACNICFRTNAFILSTPTDPPSPTTPPTTGPPTPLQSILDIVTASGNFDTLVQLVTDAGLDDLLSGDGPLTLFAPLDTAFNDVPQDTLARLQDPEWSEHLVDLLSYHVLEEAVTSDELTNGQVVPTATGETVTVTKDDTGVLINDAEVAIADIPASNGVIHAMNGVLLPNSVTKNIVDIAAADPDNFSTLSSLIAAAGLQDVLTGDDPLTVFAPTNAAFDTAFADLDESEIAALTDPANRDTVVGILTYHVVPGVVYSSELVSGPVETVQGSTVEITVSGSNVQVNDANVVTADVLANNGVIHVIDKVLEVPPDPGTIPPTTLAPIPGNVVDVATENGNFGTLLALVDQAGLTPTLSGEGPLTLFAPLDSAFTSVPQDTLTRLEDPEWSEHLVDLLSYHVLDSEVTSDELTNGQVVPTVTGETVTVTKDDAGVLINDAEVAEADIAASNGVIHAMNGVLLPNSVTKNIVDIAAADPDNFSTLSSLIAAAGLQDVLTGEDPLTVFAPTNAAFDTAFANLDESEIAALTDPANRDTVVGILTYHVVPGVVYSSELVSGPVETVEGSTVEITVSGSSVQVNDANVVTADVLANNGVIHVIDKVLEVPGANIVEVATENGNFGTLLSLVDQAGLTPTLSGEGPLTLFAPLDSAFTSVPQDTLTRLQDPEWSEHLQDLLLYHVLNGNVTSDQLTNGQIVSMSNGETVTVTKNDTGVLINDAEVAEADIPASNGVIHALNDVLLPNSVTNNIVDIANADPDNFSTLVSLLGAADLDGVLSGKDPFTVFAPTNAAFNNLEESTVAFLTNPDNKDELTKVLTYHVLPGVTYSSSITNGLVKETVEGNFVEFTVDGETVKVDNARVIQADVLANNGAIHVIDTVLELPLTTAVTVKYNVTIPNGTAQDAGDYEEDLRLAMDDMVSGLFNTTTGRRQLRGQQQRRLATQVELPTKIANTRTYPCPEGQGTANDLCAEVTSLVNVVDDAGGEVNVEAVNAQLTQAIDDGKLAESLAEVNPDSPIQVASSPDEPPPDGGGDKSTGGDDGLSGGAIAGIIIGVAAAAGVVGYLVLRQRKAHLGTDDYDTSSSQPPDDLVASEKGAAVEPLDDREPSVSRQSTTNTGGGNTTEEEDAFEVYNDYMEGTHSVASYASEDSYRSHQRENKPVEDWERDA